ncbi:hypothetical protein [Kitasatospora camelliae]|uniref:Flp pilus-assembly TadE/G-like protein n=1 Tax=Kitasatospora camelliae TaxID=3156397 RepID=A0AAU8K125_9ACTN
MRGELMARRGKAPTGPDTGAVSTFVAVSAAALVILVGIVLDLGGRLRVIEQTDALAQEAARAGGQQLDEAALRDGRGYLVDEPRAREAVQAYLAGHHLTGEVDLHTPGVVSVTIDAHYDTSLLRLIRINTLPVRGTGKAVLVHGVTNEETG